MTDMPHETNMDRAKEIADAMLPRPMIHYEVACSACGKVRKGEGPATVDGGHYCGEIHAGECCPGAAMNFVACWFSGAQVDALLYEGPPESDMMSKNHNP
jgi:hypothetical protein